MAVPLYSSPPDGGWGWVIVFSLFLESALVFGLIRSFGVFFVEFVEYFEEPAGAVSWITSIGVAVQQFASPLASALSSTWGARSVVMVGGLLASLGMILGSLASSLTHLYLSIGLVSGLGWALVFTPSVAMVTRYFCRRRTLATGVGFMGVGVASFAFSPLFQFLVDHYAWRGALLILGGLSLNLVVCGALLRPLRLLEDQSITPSPQHPSSSPLLSRLWSLFDLSLLKDWPFLTYTAAVTLFNAGYFIPYIHLVAHIQQKGFHEYQAALVMSLTALTDLLGRGVSGWVSDLRRVRLPHILALWTGLTGLSMLVIPLGVSYPVLLALGLVYGFCSGAMTPVVFSLLPDIVGVGRIFGALGLLQMIESVGGLLGSPLSGWLRDLTGDFTASFLVAGAFLLAGTLVLFALPCFFSCLVPQNQCPESGPISNGTRPPSSSQPEPQNSTETHAALVPGSSETVTFVGSGQNHSATQVENANC
ncbi:monocarboxylate transporter 13 isoform X2 [Polyodon spathula]|nr:monocarboxylate transporter 13 isoform X2 [Polyodon spathula]XP_041093337.1 monocarboxylate transporter 13 isoform X2 [Polyodon spathula]XP_041093338.1 monocarboxylate transporter 13 isoform X2 [Polyodon spathula]XP_041093339.1 monocarboxylate transporter 13 isoform X2 [Polyodon spathula]